jgi:hypothetical protein
LTNFSYVEQFFLPWKSSWDLSQTQSVLIPWPQKLLGRVLDSTSLGVDSGHHHIFNSLYSGLLNDLWQFDLNLFWLLKGVCTNSLQEHSSRASGSAPIGNDQKMNDALNGRKASSRVFRA